MALDVYLFNHDRIYFELQLGKALGASLAGDGFLQLDTASHEALHQLLALHKLRKPKTTPLLDNWQKLCALVGMQYRMEPAQGAVKASLELIKSVLIASENSKSPSSHHHSYYRTGIEVCEFLFDYLNLLGGFHPYNDKSRTDYPHVLLVFGTGNIEELQRLLLQSTCEERALNWVDFLCIRLHVMDLVIVECNMNRFCHREIYDELALEENLFTHIEWLGVENEAEVVTFLGHVFNQTQAEMISRNLGRNLHFLRLFTETIVNSPNPDFLQFLKLEHPNLAIEEAKLHRKINEVYLVGETQHLLERGDLDFAVRHALDSFVRMGGEAYAVHMIGEEMRNTPIYKALTDVGILYPEKHTVYISFAVPAYLSMCSRYLRSRPLRTLSKLEYWLYACKDALKIRDLALNKTRREEFMYHNPEIRWDTDLYEKQVGRRPDPVKSNYPVDDPGTTSEIMYPRAPFLSNPYIRPYTTIVTAFLSVAFNYPHKYLWKREEHRRKGLEKLPPANWYHKYLDQEKHAFSDLPNWQEEVKVGLTKLEERRSLLRGVYLEEHPKKFGEPVKWRHVRRFLKDVKATVKNHYLWQ